MAESPAVSSRESAESPAPSGGQVPEEERDRSYGTVVLAGSANLVIAIAKLVGGLMSGSSAMLSEAAHSMADTLNQVFLLAALRRSNRPADVRHPFGYGMERYFWALLAAVAVFVLGAGFSIRQGIVTLIHPEEQHDLLIALGVLGVAFVLDGVSLLRAVWQIRKEKVPLDDLDPTVRAVAFEDTAGVIGVVLAAAGLLLDHFLGTHVFDAIASLGIGALLAVVAFMLGRQNRERLIGQAVPDEVLAGLGEEITGAAGIDHVVDLMTMQLGPEDVLVAARVAVDPNTSGTSLADVADTIDERVRTRFPEVRHVFLDPTPD
jgi:cation diffusion facilitator family transporter